MRILTVSRIDPRKGLRVLPEVVRRTARRGFDGRWTSSDPRSGDRVKSSGTPSSATPKTGASPSTCALLGPVPLDQLLPLYRQYDLFVLPTLPGEGIPRVLLEAMAAGVPIVTTQRRRHSEPD